MQKALLVIGAIIILAGLAWPWLKTLPFGRLPGDIVWRSENMTVYIPLMSLIIVSVVLSLLFRLFR